ncbi:Pls/PosA family non-ribosomal peptide synthetase [Hyphomicrobium sp. ghe19]|uniref:Pls/PosA family non-ribosomal peptide synthetase n=1 Tax=Hyphomicrobium sp. ghe19 TaxID=2682968 RepID=UPI00136683C1|nr:Linear gramicidin synthase subunit D [Hyphomicrobium sp. ghe19]
MSVYEPNWHSLETGRTRGPRLLHHYFEFQAQRRPDHPAIEFAGETLTYEELDAAANRIANYLVSCGTGAEDLVGIYLKKSPELYAAILGILKAGAAYVPIDPRSPLERIRAIEEDAQLRLIISENALAGVIEGKVATPLLLVDRQRHVLAGQPDESVDLLLDAEIHPSALSYIIYTSGSTGRPKGVMIEHRNVVAFVKSLRSVYKVTANDRVYQGFSTAFDASVEEIWAAFSRGGTLIVPPEEVERSPADVAQFIDDMQVSYFSTVPTMLAMIDRDLPTVTTLVLGGEACSQELVTRWAKPGRRMLNTYGPTEATVVATWHECVSGEPVAIGKALPGYSTYVLDENFQPVAPGEDGELFIGGAGVGRGYMHLQTLTDQRFVADSFEPATRGRLYRTYDHVRLGYEGELYFLGRLDDQVKLRGFRIELSEIEAVLMEHPQIKAAAAAVIAVGDDIKELAAFVVCHGEEESFDRQAVDELLRRRVPAYMVPQYLDVIDELPMSTSGKVDRKNLPQPKTLLKGLGNVVAPASELETRIAAAWSEAFRLPSISVADDFFLDLGGHSLLASRCASRVREAIAGVQVSVRDFYEHRSVRALASVLESRMGGEKQENPARANVSEEAFKSVHPLMRWTTVSLQALSIAAYYGILLAPLAYMVLITTAVTDGQITWQRAAQISTMVGFAIWPSMLFLSIALKWLVIGRVKPGRYPLWSFYYFRWWFVTRFQALSWSDMFAGTPLMNLYWRAMGAKIGRNVVLSTSLCGAYDVVSIGRGSSIGLESQILGYRVEDGYLVIEPVDIGENCFIGMHCSLGLGTSMGDGARLDDMSSLPDGTAMGSYECRRGSPALLAEVVTPEATTPSPTLLRTFSFGALHLALIYVMGYFLIATVIPSAIIIAAGFSFGGPLGGAIGAFIAVPVGVLTYAIGAITLITLLQPSEAGQMPVLSLAYLRHWFVSYLLKNTKTILLPVYATVYCPVFLRALGAKIGAGSEVSTVSHVMPSLLEVGDGSFLADACLIGGERLNAGTVEIGAVRIGSRSFIGNSALIPGGHAVGDNALIGVASTPPANAAEIPDDTRWLGSPGFALPQTQRNVCFNDAEIFEPTRRAKIARTTTDTLRILLPGFIVAAEGIAFTSYLVIGYRSLPLWAVIVGIPFVAATLAAGSILLAALVKALFVGRIAPTVKPLWCRFIWNNELVNGVYETVAATTMTPLMGTPFISSCLRMMGCKVGKWCYLETTLFSEFDLVHIGDRACLNVGATIQNHLFEDRVFKADHIKIGDGCTVGNMAVVLYGTEMHAASNLGALSVLMKGDVLPAGTRWHGTPCEPLAAPKESVAISDNPRAGDGDSYAQRRRSPRLVKKQIELLHVPV